MYSRTAKDSRNRDHNCILLLFPVDGFIQHSEFLVTLYDLQVIPKYL